MSCFCLSIYSLCTIYSVCVIAWLEIEKSERISYILTNVLFIQNNRMNFVREWIAQLSWLEMISLWLNIIFLIYFLVMYKLGQFSNEFVEARTIENNKIHYRIETYKTKMNKRVFKVIDKDNDKKIYTSESFSSKLNLDRDVLRKYENLDEVVGVSLVKQIENELL